MTSLKRRVSSCGEEEYFTKINQKPDIDNALKKQ